MPRRAVPVTVAMSIAVFDEQLQKAIEPGTPTAQARLDTVRAAAEAGFAVTVFLMPILPHLTDSIASLDDALRRIKAAGAARVVFGALHLRPGVKPWFMQWLAREHPELVSSYLGLYPGACRRGAEGLPLLAGQARATAAARAPARRAHRGGDPARGTRLGPRRPFARWSRRAAGAAAVPPQRSPRRSSDHFRRHAVACSPGGWPARAFGGTVVPGGRAMARFMVTVMPFTGHVAPLCAVAAQLVRRGHDVRVYTGSAFRGRVEAAGAVLVPWRAAPDFDENDVAATFPRLVGKKGLAQLFINMEDLFINTAPAQNADLDAEWTRRPVGRARLRRAVDRPGALRGTPGMPVGERRRAAAEPAEPPGPARPGWACARAAIR